MNKGRKGNILALGASRMSLFLAGIILKVTVARWLGPEQFGAYAYVTQVAVMFAFVSNMGLHMLLTRDVARAPERVRAYLDQSRQVALGLSLVSTGAIVGYIAFGGASSPIVLAALLAAIVLTLNTQSQLVRAAFLGLRQVVHEVPAVAGGRVALISLSVIALAVGLGIPGLFAAQALAAAVTLLMLSRALHREVPKNDAKPQRTVNELLGKSLPFGANVLFSAVYLSSDILVLKAFHTDVEVGQYQAAALIIMQLPVLAQLLSTGLFPHLSRAADDPVAIAKELGFVLRIQWLISVPIAVGGLCVAAPLMGLLMGDEYAASVPALMLMLPLVPLRFSNSALGLTLTALGRQGERTFCVFVAAVFNLVSNLWVIPQWGVEGAAFTTLITEIIGVSVAIYMLRSELVRANLARPLVKVTVPALPMAAIVIMLDGAPVLLRIAAGAAVYIGGSWLIAAWSRDDLRRLRRI